MSDISRLSRLFNGVLRNVDLSTNALVVGSLKVNTTELTETILGRLISLQNGTDVDATYHTHDGRYYTETELGASAGPSGSDLIGDDDSYTNFTPTAATVKGALEGIDAELAVLIGGGAGSFSDTVFNIYDNGDPTKILVFQASGISTLTTRTITMADANVNLTDVNNAILKDGSRAFTANQPMGGFKLTGLAAGSGAGDSVRYEQAILISGANAFAANQPMGGFKLTGLAAGSGAGDSVRYEQAILASGVNAFAANQSMGGFKLTNLADPTTGTDAVNVNYLSARLNGLKPKQSVRVASTANIDLSVAADPSPVDGVTLAAGDRILLKNQTAPEENGIYDAVDETDPTTWTRSADFDSLSPIDEINGAWVAVQEGTASAGKIFVQYGTVAVLDTDAVNFEYFNPIASLIGGDMITFAGSTFSVDLATTSGLESSNPGNAAGQLRIKLEASNPSLKFTGSNELAAKLDAAGAIASGASGLAVQVDGSTIEISSNALQVKDAGITLAKLASNSVDENKITTSVAGAGLTGGGGSALAVGAGDGITVNANDVAVNTTAIAGSGLENDGSNNLRIATSAYDQSTITGGGGSAAAVASSPKVVTSEVAGEAFAATTLFAVRYAKAADAGFVAGRMYKASNDASVADDFYAIGLIKTVGALSAADPMVITKFGTMTATAHGFTVGQPVFLDAAGAVTATAPSATDTAVVRLGMVKDANTIDVAVQVVGVN